MGCFDEDLVEHILRKLKTGDSIIDLLVFPCALWNEYLHYIYFWPLI